MFSALSPSRLERLELVTILSYAARCLWILHTGPLSKNLFHHWIWLLANAGHKNPSHTHVFPPEGPSQPVSNNWTSIIKKSAVVQKAIMFFLYILSVCLTVFTLQKLDLQIRHLMWHEIYERFNQTEGPDSDFRAWSKATWSERSGQSQMHGLGDIVQVTTVDCTDV